MSKKILIDASHLEEKRVAVIDEQTKLEEFEFESSLKETLKGNIYLAKVTRVEPSLQAAFVDYGGNRHGFLAFNEIHPDYYQIPVSDREKLEKELAEAQSRVSFEYDEEIFDGDVEIREAENQSSKPKSQDLAVKEESFLEGIVHIESGENDMEIQTFGGTTEEEKTEIKKRSLSDDTQSIRVDITKKYKIQEVIKRNQILLVQIVKEERGNKGAALTTYLSLAGRYSVLMPNTVNAGGISRKIGNVKDRKRLREILNELPIEEKQSLIIRTAGQERTKPEIKRDFDYLTKTWDKIREKTLNSVAPTLVHEEGDMIRRVIRDLYTKEVDEILIEGEESYKVAKNFMRTLIPSHAKKIQSYKDPLLSLFRKYEIEKQIEELQLSTVQLRSGGSLVINSTEALVAIDINSGRATKERHIDETAYNTNMEAAVEIARQLRLRDLAGLIVIDFIDMDNTQHINSVEKCFRNAIKSDRARIQTGRISQFGLLELSRQRLRPSLFETLTQTCQACGGSGHIRSIESTALAIIRSIEDEGALGRAKSLDLFVPVELAVYLFNHKRPAIEKLEKRFKFTVTLHEDRTLKTDTYELRRKALRQEKEERKAKHQKVSKGKKSTQEKTKAEESSDKPTRTDAGQDKKQKDKRKQQKQRKTHRDKKSERLETEVKESSSAQASVAEKSDLKEDTSVKDKKKPRSRNRRRRHRPRDEASNKTEETKEKAATKSPKEGADLPSLTPSAEIAANDFGQNAEEGATPKKGWWGKLLK